MKVVAWNMAHRVASWKALEKLDADIALLSEARVLKTVNENVLGGKKTEGRDRYSRPWATAVVSRHGLREIQDARASRYGRAVKVPFENSRPGSWTAAVVSVPDVGEVTAISLYGLLDEKSDASVHRSLSEFSPIFEDARYNRLVLLGGDLNILANPQADDPGRERHLVVLARIKAFGLADCLEQAFLGRNPRRPGPPNCPCGLGHGCTHTWTKLDSKHPTVPYQDDYLFASPALAERLVSCEALAHDVWPSPSDHYPAVATFES
jgi:hypothetical protein